MSYMKASTTFAVTFLLRLQKGKDSKHLLYCRITINSSRTEFSLKRTIDPDQWHNDRNRAKGNGPEARRLNAYLQDIRLQIYEAYEVLRKEHKVLSPSAVKSRFLNEDETSVTLLDAFAYHEKEMAGNLSKGSQSHYRTTKNHVVRFMKAKLKLNDIFLSELSFSFVTKLDHYLRNYIPPKNGKTLANNAVVKNIQRLRKIINLSVKLEWIDRDPFSSYQSKFTKTERRYLSQSDLDQLINKHLPIPRLCFIRDLFVFSCYTGLAYIDAITLTADNILKGIDGENWIVTSRKKNDNPVKIPILPKAQEMIDKYVDDPRSLHNETIFPSISNQKVNAYLKEIAVLCDISQRLTFHGARHTFATTVALSNGLPIETLSKILGHSKITTTQIYAKVIQHKVSTDMKALKNNLSELNKAYDKQSNSQVS